jgi:hypothetical protein
MMCVELGADVTVYNPTKMPWKDSSVPANHFVVDPKTKGNAYDAHLKGTTCLCVWHVCVCVCVRVCVCACVSACARACARISYCGMWRLFWFSYCMMRLC